MEGGAADQPHKLQLHDRILEVNFYLGQSIEEWMTKYILWKTLSRPYPLKFFRGCLPQNLLISPLNTLSHLYAANRYPKLKHFKNFLLSWPLLSFFFRKGTRSL